ncbi:MAG: hypothetical protein JW795_06205 [Chitinivibrionales bacterium]|nr:hypothetical protein [Chitinivibrionales bacterium]
MSVSVFSQKTVAFVYLCRLLKKTGMVLNLSLIIDNSTVTIAGSEIKSFEHAMVTVDKNDPEEIGRAERIMVQVSGPRHLIVVEIMKGAAAGTRIERRFSIPTMRSTSLLLLPVLVQGLPDSLWHSRFVPPEMEDAPAEQMIQQEESDVLPAEGGE